MSLGRLLLIVLAFILPHATSAVAQDVWSARWQIGAWDVKSHSVWPLPALAALDSVESGVEFSGYGAVQYSPGALLRGTFMTWPSAGGLGWQLGGTWHWNSERWSSSGSLEHWRIAGVNAADWNEAWQWATWDGMGWAWNPNQTDIGVVRAVGSIAYQASPGVQVEAGNRQHHWGHGWRSLWLDRQAAPLPFLRLHAATERVRYIHLIGRTGHRSVGSPTDYPGAIPRSPGAYALKRHSWLAAHVVEVDFSPAWEGSLFGAVTWLANDSGYTRRFEPVYAAPFIAFRPAEYALGSADNALIGASLTHRPHWANETLRVHGQLLLDELVVAELLDPAQWWANKWAVLGSIGWNSPNGAWKAVMEACAVRPYTYAHTATAQSWTHNRQPLAHPAGSNFIEGRSHLQWQAEPWHVHLGMVMRRQGIDERVELDKTPAFSIGADPLLSYSSRPADYGVGLPWDGDGLAGETDIINQRLVWVELAYDVAQVQAHQLFVRGLQQRAIGQRTDENWWRIECGIRLNRVLEERNW